MASLSERVAEEVRALLARRRMSAAALGRELGVSQTYVWRRLEGQTPFDLTDLERIAKVLDVHVLDLLPVSRPVGAASGGGSLNASSGHPAVRPTPVRMKDKHGRHAASSAGPLSQRRRDSTRPVSAIPANRRRPTPTGPGVRPMSA